MSEKLTFYLSMLRKPAPFILYLSTLQKPAADFFYINQNLIDLKSL